MLLLETQVVVEQEEMQLRILIRLQPLVLIEWVIKARQVWMEYGVRAAIIPTRLLHSV
jgi:hypothetical protein